MYIANFYVPFQFAMITVWVIMASKVTMDIDSSISLTYVSDAINMCKS